MEKNIFLFIAIMAIGVVVIPSVYSIFAGEHFYYDTGKTSCLKCHSDIRKELDSSVYHADLTCENCHEVTNLNSAGHGNVIISKCVNCHNVSFDKDSHKPFVLGANSSSLMAGNDACISCHTKKSLNFQMNLDDTYKLNAIRIDGIDGWQVSNYSKFMANNNPLFVQFNGSGGDHTFPSLTEFKCEKCHLGEHSIENSSIIHTTLSCGTCHQLNPGFHAANIPSCINCHTYDISNQADAHAPFVKSADTNNFDGENNIACPLCHSNFNKDITFTRPSFVEYNIVNSSGKWLIENLAIGEMKDVEMPKNLAENGNVHNISLEDNCVLCHDDIKNAVISGGHSNEQWKGKHNYAGYTDMNSYCKSCHMPSTQKNGQSPYPAYPFNSNVHGSMKISCIDCHTKSDLLVNINGNMVTPPYDGSVMGNIEDSIRQQPYFIQSYLCIACKNVGNPGVNNSLHFKIFTEPQVNINVSAN